MLRKLLTIGFIFSFSVLVSAQDGNSNKGKVKAQTQFSAQVEKILDVETSTIGEDVNFLLSEDVTGEGMTLLKGSEVFARIVNVEAISKDNKSSKISIMFDFVQNGEDFMTCKAIILGIEQIEENVKFENSETFEGGTVLSLSGKNLKIEQGKIFRIKLIKDLLPN